jgi:hypothetical protein
MTDLPLPRQIGDYLYHCEYFVVICRAGVEEAVRKEPPPCRMYTAHRHESRFLHTLRRAKRVVLATALRRATRAALARKHAKLALLETTMVTNHTEHCLRKRKGEVVCRFDFPHK